MIRFAVPAILLVAACAATAAASGQSGAGRTDARQQARFERTLAGLTPGTPLRCLRRDQFNEIRSFDGTILYVAGRNRVYRNNVVGTCPGLRRDDIVVVKTFGGRYCSGDIVQTRARTGGMLTGSCSLGEFTPYRR
jgi:hypothetical protein